MCRIVLTFHNRSQSRKLLITIEPNCKRIAGLLIFHVGCVWILSIVFGLYNCGIWHRGCSITYTPPYAKKLCQKELCRLLLDYANCNWIVQLYLDCTIVIGLYDCIWIVLLYLDYIIAGFVLPIPPPLCAKKLCQKQLCRL